MTRRLVTAACAAALLASMSVSSVFAGEITGNGRSLHVTDSKWGTGLHARSVCAFSGQEDLQFVDENDVPLAVPHKGVPTHSQNWGHTPGHQDLPFTPGLACNPIKGAGLG
jgi:hypothetical protein